MTGLVTLAQAAPLLGCRDPRTARKRLAELGVPVLQLGRRVLVDPGEIARAVRARQRPLEGALGARPSPGVQLPAGARLWDSPGTTYVGAAPRKRPTPRRHGG